ncbi:hypothetical protein [Nitrosomonas ureae]|uniref:Uncharacterized protein n=1 Tax=Nitrosomonas ureae TaxID=44577 RepID=A0A2T5ISS9_9PROT|nr:hypothetical protein [Nitrosomonas ureae]PTQ86901.1 hypothetical protein C8R28_100896 [Nitrosomonas ureae]
MNYSSLQIPSRPSPDYIPPTDPQPETIPPEQEPPFESPPEIEPPERIPPIRDPEIPVPEGNINLENKPASAGFLLCAIEQ